MDDTGLHDPYTYMRVPAGTLISAEGALSHDERKGNVMSAKIIAVTNQKGGTGKTTTTQNLGDALASKGLEVLLVDMDHQASLSILCGVDQPDQLTDDQIVATPILQVANHETPNTRSIIRHVHEHVDLLASNVMLSRICKSAVELLRAQGVKAGLIRPITVHPFPYAAYDHIDYSKVKAVLDVEMSIPAQFVDDVAVAVKDRCLIETCLCSGGNIMSRDKVLAAVKKIMEGK